jgi:mRNA interferase YafQ
MLKVVRTTRFRKDYRKACAGTTDLGRLREAIVTLVSQQPLPQEYRDHPLKGYLASCRECHLAGGLLLVYRLRDDALELVRMGTHSDLFGR